VSEENCIARGALVAPASVSVSSPRTPGRVVAQASLPAINDGQDARPTNTGQSPEDRHPRQEPGNEKDTTS
jgi:hypothetical protein